jgi:hypothetical protein
MSCVAAARPVASERRPITPTETGGPEAAASHRLSPRSASCAMKIHPRLRPMKGGA